MLAYSLTSLIETLDKITHILAALRRQAPLNLAIETRGQVMGQFLRRIATNPGAIQLGIELSPRTTRFRSDIGLNSSTSRSNPDIADGRPTLAIPIELRAAVSLAPFHDHDRPVKLVKILRIVKPRCEPFRQPLRPSLYRNETPITARWPSNSGLVKALSFSLYR